MVRLAVRVSSAGGGLSRPSVAQAQAPPLAPHPYSSTLLARLRTGPKRTLKTLTFSVWTAECSVDTLHRCVAAAFDMVPACVIESPRSPPWMPSSVLEV